MTVMIGVSASNDQKSIYDRSCGTGYVIECAEAQISADAPALAPFVYSLSRRGYGYLSNSWPPVTDGAQGNMNRNAEAGRIAFYSHKAADAASSWQQVINGAYDAQIDARGAQIAAWFDAWPNYSFLWSFHHEPDNDWSGAGYVDENAAATAWRGAFQRILTRWIAQGVPIWSGSQDGTTQSHGLIPTGPVLIAGAQNGPDPGTNPDITTGTSSVAKLNRWYGTYGNWLWQNIQACGSDGYNQGPVWRSFSECVGDYPHNEFRRGFKWWANYRRDQMNADSRVLLQTWWEFATRERGDQLNPYTSESTFWTNTGHPATKAWWMAEMTDYFTNIAPDWYGVTWFDSGAGANAGEGWQTDTSASSWAAWVAALQQPIYGYIGEEPPPPPAGFVPGAMSVAMHARLAVS